MEFTPAGLEEGILPLVSRPNRYQPPLGIDGPHDFKASSLRVCVVYPGPYEVGMTRPALLGLHEAMRRVLQDTSPEGGEGLVDLVFAPGDDLERELTRRGLPLFGLFARRPLSEYDLLLVLLESPLALPDLVAMLELGGVPPRTASRGDEAPMVVLGGAAAATPAGAAPFADAFLVGDPEAFAADLAEALRRGKNSAPMSDREAALSRLQTGVGVYLPGANGTTSGGRGADSGKGNPRFVEARWLARLPSPARLVSSSETAVEGIVLEIARSQGVRDPASSPPTLRLRPTEEALRQAEAAVTATGIGEVFLPGGEASRHPEVQSLLEAMNRRFRELGVRVSLEEVDPAAMDPALARELCRGRRPRLIFEPVACSERLRETIGRPLSRQEMARAVETALRGSWAEIRLRVLLGLPGETKADHAEWVEMVEAVRARGNREGPPPRMAVEVIPFMPRPHTRWERERVVDSDSWSRVVSGWQQRLQRKKVKVWAHSPEAAGVEATLLRGDERVAEVVEGVAGRGLRRQDTPESFDSAAWRELLAKAGVPWGGKGGKEKPPWAHILLDVPTGDDKDRVADPTGEEAVADRVPDSPVWGFPSRSSGRRVRRAGAGRAIRRADRYRLRFSKEKPLQFLSHLDVTRVFERAFRRTRLPVAVSRGKDRRWKVSYGPPLPLGMTSSAEYFDLTLAREVPEQFVQAVNTVLPRGLAVTAGAPIRSEVASLNSVVQVADYEVSFPDTLVQQRMDGMNFDELRIRLKETVKAALSVDVLEVTRVRGEESRTFNARPSLIGAEVVSDETGRFSLKLRLTLNRADSVRPELLTRSLCRWVDFDERLLHVHRSGLYIPGRNQVLDPLDVVARGFAWWRETARREAAQ